MDKSMSISRILGFISLSSIPAAKKGVGEEERDQSFQVEFSGLKIENELCDKKSIQKDYTIDLSTGEDSDYANCFMEV